MRHCCSAIHRATVPDGSATPAELQCKIPVYSEMLSVLKRTVGNAHCRSSAYAQEVSKRHSVTVSATSKYPKDWGRALGAAMTELHEVIDCGRTSDLERLFEQELRLIITEKQEGVEITVSWSPPI